jgi:hypothetical protein
MNLAKDSMQLKLDANNHGLMLNPNEIYNTIRDSNTCPDGSPEKQNHSLLIAAVNTIAHSLVASLPRTPRSFSAI